jgi:hypothetical protein
MSDFPFRIISEKGKCCIVNVDMPVDVCELANVGCTIPGVTFPCRRSKCCAEIPCRSLSCSHPEIVPAER